MFDSLINAVQRERLKLNEQIAWLEKFRIIIQTKSILEPPWQEELLIHEAPHRVPKITQIAGVDGGVIAEAMTGFDLILYRAVVAIFQGVGDNVKAEYLPSFNPEPRVFFSPSLISRSEFQRLSTLLRLYAEYEVAKLTIEEKKPTVLFIDGKVMPLTSDFSESSSKLIKQIEQDVKNVYSDMVELSLKNKVQLCGVVKDSRSREFVRKLKETIPYLIASKKIPSQDLKGWVDAVEDMQDSTFGDTLLEVGERTAWLETSIPNWLELHEKMEVWTCLIKPLDNDQPVRLEITVPKSRDNLQDYLDITLGAYSMLCNHGMPLALPTIILEADERTKMTNDHLHSVIDQISISLGIPKDQLRKRRYFSQSLT